MFGLLNSSQIYGLQREHESTNNSTPTNTSNNNNSNKINSSLAAIDSNPSIRDKISNKHRRSTSSASDNVKESRFFASLSSMQQGIKSPTNFIEKFIKSELLNGYDTIKNYKNFQHSNNSSTSHISAPRQGSTAHSLHPDGILTSFNCLQGSYRSNCDGEFYEAVNVNLQKSAGSTTWVKTPPEMTIKCSKNLLAEPTHALAAATLQNYQKLPEDCDHDLPAEMATASSGASSGEFNSDTTTTNTTTMGPQTPSSSLYKKLSFGGRSNKHQILGAAQTPTNEVTSDHSSSSISTTTTNSSANNNGSTTNASQKSSDLQRSSSASSSGDCVTSKERKKLTTEMLDSPLHAGNSNATSALTPERAQRRKIMQTISNYDQQNKFLQRELAKEKRRRTEELACVVKSLICFESKLKTDMKTVNQRLLEKDAEICRLVRQNRALRKRLGQLQKQQLENVKDEGVVEDGDVELLERDNERELMEQDCLVLEALQCINCRKQFYDIELKEGWTQTCAKDGSRNNDDHTTEHGSSSDDTTVSSSFYGARRSVRYTSKRTSGTFRDYMRSRAMNIDDPALLANDNNSEENTSTISHDDSQTSYEKLNMYSRTIERMHGVKCESERESDLSGQETTMRSASRLSSKSSKSSRSNHSSNSSSKVSTQIEEDDGIFSPTQDDDFDDELVVAVVQRQEPLLEERPTVADNILKVVQHRTREFSEASPKQVYETSTDDWYASASDQEEIGSSAAKSYGHGAVNPVLECVNQILLQQSMDECLQERAAKNATLQLQQQQQPHAHTHTPKTTQTLQDHLQVPTNNLPRRSSLSGRRSSRSNSHSSDGGHNSSRNGTLTRKRVHFSTKNSMVHVPRSDDVDDDEDAEVEMRMRETANNNKAISTLSATHYFPMNYCPSNAANLPQGLQSVSDEDVVEGQEERARLEILNYESIYSNEYEPIGSEHNAYNLYVDMESAQKLAVQNSPGKMLATKMPPALPPKPANLLKFKKALQQLDEVPDEHELPQDNSTPNIPNATTNSNCNSNSLQEPDYCSISEVNVAITSVQTVADVHKAPATESEMDPMDAQSLEVPASELELEVSTVASDDTCAASQKTDEIEEIFADIPKLPNVAAIIAPKAAKYEQQQQQQSDYLVMSPKSNKVDTANLSNALLPNTSTPNSTQLFMHTSATKTPKMDFATPTSKLQLPVIASGTTTQQQPYKRKHMPNILAEINKRLSQPNSPTTPTAKVSSKPTHTASSELLKQHISTATPSLPLQAEFDWYNLDAEYGRAPAQLGHVEGLTGSKLLEEINEDHECVVAAADEYNLDEEFSLSSEKTEILTGYDVLVDQTNAKNSTDTKAKGTLNAAISEAVNYPLFNENSTILPINVAKAKKMRKNLASFEKFIEGSTMSAKPLPTKRKIYFAGPFV